MRWTVLQFLNDDTGATSIEYAIIAGGVAIVIVAAVNTTGTNLNNAYNSVVAAL